MSTILVVSAEMSVYTRIVGCVESQHAVFHVETYRRALKRLRATRFDVVFLDDDLAANDPWYVLERMVKYPDCPPLVFLTSEKRAEVKAEAVRRGAADCLGKPLNCEQLLSVIKKHSSASKQAIISVREKEEGASQSETICFPTVMIAESPAMRSLVETARAAAMTSHPVLIEGESGTGKETLARFIHSHYCGGTAPFVVVNCQASQRSLFAADLSQAAAGSTVFFDEVAALDSSSQQRLIELLQQGNGPRIIAATSQNIAERVARRNFDESLYWALASIPLRIPPLRHRRADILPLAAFYLDGFVRQAGRAQLRLPQEARELLLSAQWSGNVRELQNVMQRVVLFSPPESREVPAQLLQESFQSKMRQVVKSAITQRWTVDELEKEYLQGLLDEPDLEMGDICRILQIDQSTLYRKRKRYGL